MTCNAIINKCDLKIDNSLETFSLSLEITAPDVQFYSKNCEIVISETYLNSDDTWSFNKAKPKSNELLPLFLLVVFDKNSFSEIAGQPCRIVVEEGKLMAIGHFLHNDWIDLQNFENFELL